MRSNPGNISARIQDLRRAQAAVHVTGLLASPVAFAVPLLAAFLLLCAQLASAYPNSPSSLQGMTLRDVSAQVDQCGGCHTVPGGIVSTITGTNQLVAGGSTTLTLTSTGATNGHRMGTVISTSAPHASPTPLAGSAPLTYFSTRELVHNSSLAALHTVSGGSANYTFTFRNPAGAAVGSTVFVYAVARIGLSTTSNSGWDNAPTFTITTIPSAPTLLSATTVNSDGISLSWSGGSGPRYRVLRKTGSFPASNSDGTIVRSCASTGTSFTNTGLAPNTTYFYRVYACDSGSTLFSTSGATDSATTKQTQTITFNAQSTPSRAYVQGGTFTVAPVASSTSDQTGLATGLAITHTGSGACSGTDSVAPYTMTIQSAGTCTITASQGGGSSFDAATSKQQQVTITAIVPGPPTGLTADPAINSALISFTPPTNTGGVALTGYTASCTPAGSGTASAAATSINITGLTSNTAYSCSVRATNSAGQSTPAASNFSTTNIAFSSANNTAFTVLQAGQTFQVTATGATTPTISMSGTLPTGVTFNGPGTSPRTISGTPATGTSGVYHVNFSASNADGNAVQSFTFTVNKITQTITWNPVTLPVRSFGEAPFQVTASGGASGNAVVFTTSTPGTCSASAGNPSTITILGAGDCTLNADQAGGTNHAAATQVKKTFTIVKGQQSITFKGQADRPLVPNGTFALSPAPSASSGLTVVTTSNTPGICTVSGNTVTMLTLGACEIFADQPGDPNYEAASQETSTINIVPNVPNAPVIGAAIPGNTIAKVVFDAPDFDGGSPILDFRTSCTPGPILTTGGASPITVPNLVNGQLYTCSVQARNAVGYSLASATTTVTPAPVAGSLLWTNTCEQCHGAVPTGVQLNGAGTTGAVLQFVRATRTEMINTPEVQALLPADLDAIAAYINDQLPAIADATAIGKPKSFSVASHITLNTLTSSFTSVETVEPPQHGTLSAWNGTSVVYMPNPGYNGPDWFTYRGKHTTPSVLLGDKRTINIDVSTGAVTLTTSATGPGTVISFAPTTGINCPGDCEESYRPTDVTGSVVVSLFAEPSPGAAFSAWGGACAATGIVDPSGGLCDVTMDASKSVSATFIVTGAMLTVSKGGTGTGSVASSPGGINCGSTCAALFTLNASVTLTPTPAPGSTFTGWSGDCTGTGACQVTMSQARTVTANFGLAATGDADNDGIPNGVELVEGRNPNLKDNDVFANPRLFTMQQYRDFLSREGDAGGIQFYVDLLNAGTLVRANVIENFFNSPEFQGVGSPVARLYFATFLRIPDYDGLLFQINVFRGGASLAAIANNFTLSPEFTQRYGALTNTQYIVLLYQNILGRTPVQAEIDFYVNRLNTGFTRGDVLVGFSESPEYQANTAHDVYVTMMYVGMLRRAPEQAGFDFWVNYMDGGNSGLALILGFLQSQEYHNRFLP